MRLLIFLLITLLGVRVAADGSRTYERVWIYYAYLLDVKAASVNGGQRTILVDLGPDKSFMDVMEAFEYEKIDLTLQADIGENRLPDVRDAANHMYNAGYIWEYNYEKVLKWPTRYRFVDFIKYMGRAIHTAKSALSPSDIQSMRTVFDNLDLSLQLALEQRAIELSDFIRKRAGRGPGAGITLQYVDVENGRILSLPGTAMLYSHIPDVEDRLHEWLKDYYREYTDAEGHRRPFAEMNTALAVQRQISCGG